MLHRATAVSVESEAIAEIAASGTVLRWKILDFELGINPLD
jgi:hypothetical protein